MLIIKKNKENQYFLLELYYPGYSIGHKDYFTSFFSIKQNNYYEMKKVKKLFNSNDVHLIVLKNNFNESNYLIKSKNFKEFKEIKKSHLIELFFYDLYNDNLFHEFHKRLILEKKFRSHDKDMYLKKTYGYQKFKTNNELFLERFLKKNDHHPLDDNFYSKLISHMEKNCNFFEYQKSKKLICNNFIKDKSKFLISIY